MAERAAVKRSKDIMNIVNKAVGSDVLQLGSDEKFTVTFIPTGVEPIDHLLDGGIPRGRFTTLTGDYSTLKSYIGYKAIGQAQMLDEVAVLIDTEHAYDEEWAKRCGVDTESLIVLHPENGELAIDAAEAMIREDVGIIVFDSVAATLPQAEQQKRLHGENIQPGRIAALMSAASRRLTTANEKTAVLWINQLRENIGVTFGATTKATGGRALPYYSSYIVNLVKTGKITRDLKLYTGDNYSTTKEQIGQKYKAELQKSKLSRPWREVHFQWSLTEGEVDVLGFLVNRGVDEGVIKFKGAKWEGLGLTANGKDKFKKLLAKEAREDDSILDPLRALNTKRGVEALGETAPTTPKTASKKPAAKKIIKKA